MDAKEAKKSRWSLTHTENRIGCAIVATVLTGLTFQIGALPLLVGVVVYFVLTAIVTRRRRN